MKYFGLTLFCRGTLAITELFFIKINCVLVLKFLNEYVFSVFFQTCYGKEKQDIVFHHMHAKEFYLLLTNYSWKQGK